MNRMISSYREPDYICPLKLILFVLVILSVLASPGCGKDEAEIIVVDGEEFSLVHSFQNFHFGTQFDGKFRLPLI